jgi:hypothetical protein
MVFSANIKVKKKKLEVLQEKLAELADLSIHDVDIHFIMVN